MKEKPRKLAGSPTGRHPRNVRAVTPPASSKNRIDLGSISRFIAEAPPDDIKFVLNCISIRSMTKKETFEAVKEWLDEQKE